LKKILLLLLTAWCLGGKAVAQEAERLPEKYRILIVKACELRSLNFSLEEIKAYTAHQLTLPITNPQDKDYGTFYTLNEPNAVILGTVGYAHWEQNQHCRMDSASKSQL
jgi:hypothetical protein